MSAVIARLAPPRGISRGLWGYAGAIAARGLEVGGKLGLYAMAARVLGAEQSGLFFLCLTWVSFTSTAARLGLERATTRHIAAELAVGQGLAARRAATVGLISVFAASLLAAGLTYLAAPYAAVWLFHQPSLIGPLRLSAWLLPPQTLLWGISFVLVGLNRGVIGQMVLSTLPPILAFIGLLAGLDDLQHLLLAYGAANTLCVLLGTVPILRDWRRVMIDQPDRLPPPEALPSLWTSAWPFFFVEMAQITYLSLPVFALGIFTTPDQVSEFSIASRASNLVNSVLISISLISAPRFAEFHRRGEFSRLHALNVQVRMLALVLCGPVLFLMLVCPRVLLHALGSEFEDAWLALVILALGQTVSCLLPCQDNVLAMTGHGALLRRLNWIQLFTTCFLALTLVPHTGLLGAALASSVSLAVYAVGCTWGVRRMVPGLWGRAPQV